MSSVVTVKELHDRMVAYIEQGRADYEIWVGFTELFSGPAVSVIRTDMYGTGTSDRRIWINGQ